MFASKEVIATAVDQALANSAGSQLLTDVSLRDDGLCINVSGTPAERH
jgi:hypothetical protein